MIKLLSALKKLPADNCFILTYNLELPFFEEALFEPLYSSGCRNTVLICDPQQYQITLKQDASILKYAGQRYLLYAGQTSKNGAFHPKLILKTSKNAGQLFITSGNLSQSGYTHNCEVATSFTFDERNPDLIAWQAFRWAYDVLTKIADVSDQTQMVQERLTRLWRTTPWLREEHIDQDNSSVWLLHNLESTILDQVINKYLQIDGSKVNETIIVSPYFDAGANVFTELLNKLGPDNIRVFTQTAQGLRKESLDKAFRNQVSSVEFFGLDSIQRRLHAKAILFKTDKGVWLTSGSANFSSPALLKTSFEGNTELISLRYEKEPSYFDEWLTELIQSACPFDWSSLTNEIEKQEKVQTPPEVTLLSATIKSRDLEISLNPEPISDCSIRLIINNDLSDVIDFSYWNKTDNNTLRLNCSVEFAKRTEFPIFIAIQVIHSDGKITQTNPMLVHNIIALEKYGQLVRKVNRPPVPDGLKPENEEQCAQILEMIQNMLATNQEQLGRHNSRILSERIREQEELSISDAYNPEDHIVPEPIRRPNTRLPDSSAIYPNYEEHLTYQEILNAVLSLSYHPEIEVGSIPFSDLILPQFSTSIIDSTQSSHQSDENQETVVKTRARIKSGFKRLVDNFVLGLNDSDYVEMVPAIYLLELWSIITAFLKVVWQMKMLEEDQFIDHSLTLLYAFWGRPTQPGIWESIKQNVNPELIENELKRLRIPINLWVYIHAVAKVLVSMNDRRIFDLSSCIRIYSKTIEDPIYLIEIQEENFKNAWRTCYPDLEKLISVDELVNELMTLSTKYDDQSLKLEINSLTGGESIIELANIAEVSHIPCLNVSIPLSDETIDLCWKAFSLFTCQPQRKPYSWARFTNTKPLINNEDIENITAFYRSDNKSLIFAAKRFNKSYSPDIFEKEMSHEKMITIQSVMDFD